MKILLMMAVSQSDIVTLRSVPFHQYRFSLGAPQSHSMAPWCPRNCQESRRFFNGVEFQQTTFMPGCSFIQFGL